MEWSIMPSWRSLHKIPIAWVLESFQVEQVEVLEEFVSWEGTEAPWPFFPYTLLYTSLPSGCSCVSFIRSFYNKLINSKQTIFLSSGGCFNKLIKSKERMVGTSNLQPNDQKHKWQPGLVTSICKVGVQFCGTEPLTYGIRYYLQIECQNLNCRTSSWCYRENICDQKCQKLSVLCWVVNEIFRR